MLTPEQRAAIRQEIAIKLVNELIAPLQGDSSEVQLPYKQAVARIAMMLNSYDLRQKMRVLTH